MAQLYFDTNIYSFIGAANESAQIAKLLAAHQCVLVASSGNLFETFAIESPDLRQQEISLLVELADVFESHPDSWLHALELRREIKRLRPKWLRSVVYKRHVSDFLRSHQELWHLAKQAIMPELGSTYAAYKRDFEDGVRNHRNVQKEIRRSLVTRQGDFALVSPNDSVLKVDLDDPEVFWRVECLQTWYAAIECGSPASRDYVDWRGPYLRSGCFRDDSYPSFWLEDAMSEKIPLNRLVIVKK